MATFNNGESGLSVRNKINEAIDKVDGNSAFDNDIDVNGNVSIGDNYQILLGASNDLTIEPLPQHIQSTIPYFELLKTS